jgi:hypothetical protein
MPTPAGYSGTPLARKLGIAAGMHIVAKNAPEEYLRWLEPLPENVTFEPKVSAASALVHLFIDRKDELARHLAVARKKLAATAVVWVSWPKKSSRVPTDVTEDVIREVALPLGFVDIKVCAVSDVWSGLKLVVRKELR